MHNTGLFVAHASDGGSVVGDRRGDGEDRGADAACDRKVSLCECLHCRVSLCS